MPRDSFEIVQEAMLKRAKSMGELKITIVRCSSLGTLIAAAEGYRRRHHSSMWSSQLLQEHWDYRNDGRTRTPGIPEEGFPQELLRRVMADDRILKPALDCINSLVKMPSGIEELRRINHFSVAYHRHGNHYLAQVGMVLFIAEAWEERHTTHGRFASIPTYHNDKGPAMSWADGFKVYFLNNVLVPEALVMAPEKLTTEQIVSERNTEIVRVMLEKMGVDAFVKRAKAKVIDSDAVPSKTIKVVDGKRIREDFIDKRTLYEIDLPNLPDKKARMLLVECPSTGHKVLIGVPPRTKTAKAAADWIERKDEDYEFVLET